MTPGLRNSVAPVEEIRRHFPALERRQGGRPVAYFDGPGGTQVPRAVVEAMSDYLYHHNANTHWAYPTSRETDELLARSRQALADFLNADASEIVFGLNMTTLAFHLARALGRRWGPGDEIVVTELDHHANVAPWRALARERGVTVHTVRLLTEAGQLDWDDFARKLSGRTRLTAVGAASNALGTVTDVRRAAELARRAGALVFVDAVHYAPHQLVDVRALGCDFLGCSAYKFYGPHVGVLYAREELLASTDFPKLDPAPDTAPERAETGTQNHEGICGAAAAVDFLASLAPEGATRRARLAAAFASLHARGSLLLRELWEGLASVPNVTLYGPPPDAPRTPTLSFTLRGVASTRVAARLAEEGVFASHGDFYAATIVERFEQAPEGFVRAGCACYTNEEEVSRFVRAVERVARYA